MNGQDTRLFYIYGWRGSKQYYLANATTHPAAIWEGELAVKAGRHSKVEVHDVRDNRIVWKRP